MNSTFLKAAASYFGINPEQVREGDWHNDGGTMVATFSFAINDGDLIGVMDRMKTMRELPSATPGVAGRTVQHLDAELKDEPELPESVWVDASLLDESQKQMGSHYRADSAGARVLMQVSMLRPDQMPFELDIQPSTPWPKMSWEDAVAQFGPQFDAMSAHDKSFYGSRGRYIEYKLQNL
jgi:hypothetical protein